MYLALAEFTVFVHLVYIGFVVIGELLILAGILFRWQWIRNSTFRASHLIMIVIVAIESLFAIVCPITNWQYDLERLAGQNADEGSFIGRALNSVLFPFGEGVHIGDGFLNTIYISFALLVVATLVFAPPRVKGPWKLYVSRSFTVLGITFLLFPPVDLTWNSGVDYFGQEVVDEAGNTKTVRASGTTWEQLSKEKTRQKFLGAIEWRIGLAFLGIAAGFWLAERMTVNKPEIEAQQPTNSPPSEDAATDAHPAANDQNRQHNPIASESTRPDADV